MIQKKGGCVGVHKGGLNWIVAAGVVGADIGTSIFYGTGILFPIVGYLAPVFVLSTCLLMWLFKATYQEGLALSPYNGGAYSMILRTVGRRFAVVAGSLTFVSYLATAAVSALSGGLYFSSLFEGGLPTPLIVLFSFLPIALFSLLNTRGIKEPAKLVTLIAATHFALLIIISIWGLGYLAFNFEELDFSKLKNIKPDGELTFALIMYGFAASFLGITGFESAAQIVEELEEPAMETVRKLYKTVVILVSMTAPMISFLCLILLTTDEVQSSLGHLLSSLAHKLGGQALLTIIVFDATLTLFAAVNTAFVGFIGLTTTMAKQGNLPSILLYRVAHKFPSIQGYPLIAIPFALVAMSMSAFVAGEIDIVAKVYEIAFLGVMVSFSLGVVLMRNRSQKRVLPMQYVSHWLLKVHNLQIPLAPLISGVILAFAALTLLGHSESNVLLMLVTLFGASLLAMVYFRWGELESRLEKRNDLRLGIGKFANDNELPENLPKYVLCAGGTGARRLINKALKYLLIKSSSPFELIIFHAEDGKDPEGFFFELLQRVVSQQIAPIYDSDFILTVKIVPGSLTEGLHLLKKTYNFDSVLLGTGRNPFASQKVGEELMSELDLKIEYISGK